jgi:hypothetical protein
MNYIWGIDGRVVFSIGVSITKIIFYLQLICWLVFKQKICCLGNFKKIQEYSNTVNAVVLTVVTLLYTKSPELLILESESLYFLTSISLFLHSQTLVTTILFSPRVPLTMRFIYIYNLFMYFLDSTYKWDQCSTVMCHLMLGVHSEKCVTRHFNHCIKMIEFYLQKLKWYSLLHT